MPSLRYSAGVVVTICVVGLTGFALADGHGPTTKQVAASFSTTAQHASTKTCTGADGSYTLTDGMYSGTVNGTLTGGVTDTLQLHVRSLVNQATGDGSATEQFTIKHGMANVANGSLSAVESGSGALNGFLAGHVPGTPPSPPPGPRARLLANFSGTLSAGSFNGQIGGNATMTNSAVEQSGGCPAPPERPHHHDHPFAHPGPPSPPGKGH